MMSYKVLRFGGILIAFLMIQNLILGQSHPTKEEFPEAILERTEVRTLHSDYVDQDYELFISLPRSYNNTNSNYPVIFILDSYRAFPIVKGLTDALSWPNPQIPEVILVGIGYGGKGQGAALNWVVGRTRDLSPTRNMRREESYENRLANGGVNIDIETGGGPQFLDFIRKELLPLIDSSYRIDNTLRMLSGYSAGGLFGLYVLFNDPELFSKYFIGSPSITSFSDSMTFKYELDYADTKKDLPADVFISVGQLEEENAESMKKIADLMYSRKYKGLNLQTMVFEKENHFTCYTTALNRALMVLLGNKNDE